MKKVLSFVLVLAMILGCTSMAFATTANGTLKKKTDYVAPFTDAETSAVATILKDLGILDGTGNGNVELDKTIDRASFCKILMVALGLADSVEQQATKFTDVPKTHWASGYIALANQLGYVDGKTATKFDPEGAVTANEAIAFVLKALGYNQKYLDGAWPQNYLTIALELQLLGKNYVFDAMNLKSGVDEVTREYAFTLLTRALNKYCVKWTEATTANAAKWGYITQAVGGDTTTLLGKVLGTYADMKLSQIYYVIENKTLSQTSADAFKNFANVNAYVGRKVNILCMTGGAMIGLAKLSSKVLEGKLIENDTDKFGTFAAIDGTTYTVKNSDASTGMLKNYNGEWVDNARAITSKDAVTIEVVFDTDIPTQINEIKSAEFSEVNGVYVLDTTMAALFASGKIASFPAITVGSIAYPVSTTGEAATLDTYHFELTGVDSYADIAKNDVVEVYLSTPEGLGASATKKIVKMNIVKSYFEAPVTKYVADTKTYTVNGKDYKYSRVSGTAGNDDLLTVVNTDKAIASAIKGATMFAFWLDSKDAIVQANYTTEVATHNYKYAVVLEVKDHLDQLYVAESKTVEPTTNNSIRLLDLESMEEVKFTFTSQVAVKLAAAFPASATANSTWDYAKITNGAIWGYEVVEDELVFLTPVAVGMTDLNNKGTWTTNAGLATFAATSFQVAGAKTELLADGAKIVVAGADAANQVATKAAYYVAATDLSKKTTAANKVLYRVNTNGKVDLAYVATLDAVLVKDKFVTAFAIQSVPVQAVTQIEVLQPGAADTETYTISSAALEYATVAALTKSAIYKAKVVDGKIVTMAAIASFGALGTTVGAVLTDNVLYLDSVAKFNCEAPVIMKYDATTGVKKIVAATDLAIAIAGKTSNVVVYDLDGNGLVDLIIVDATYDEFNF